MNKFFIDDLLERLETLSDTVKVIDQQSLKKAFILYGYLGYQDNFPMICNEYTPDSNFDVDIDESKFLNDKSYNGTWIVGCDDDTFNFLICLKTYEQILFIDVLEVNEDMRGQGLGGNIVSIIESVAETYYPTISVSPFDTDAINFWEHMEYYKEENYQSWIKKL